MKMDDTYAKGMIHYEDDDNQSLINYTNWQLSLVLPYFGKNLLEVGAGNGRFTRAVISSGHKFDRFTAIEPSQTLFSTLQSTCSSIELINSTVDEIDLSYFEQFDTIYSIHVMEHVQDDNQFLSDILKLLRKEGIIILMVPALNLLMSDLDRNIGHFRRYDKGMLRSLAVNHNLKTLVLRYDNFIGIFGWLILCKILKIHYQTGSNKKTLFSCVNLFDKYILPLISVLEKRIPPPVGLNLTIVLQK